MLKKFFSITALAIICFSFFTSTVYAADIINPKVLKDTYVYDEGNFLDDENEKKINQLLDSLEEQTTIEFAVITIPSLNGKTIESYANKLANNLGIGKKEKNNGILLLISKTDTRVRLEIGDGLQGILTDSISGRILDKYFVPKRSEGNYDEATFLTVEAVLNKLADSEEYSFTIEGLQTDVKLTPEEEADTAELIVFIIIIIIVIALMVSGYFVDGDIFYFFPTSGSSGGSSGGSFGGGHFGGGGASR